jgi:eukaryotic-like serine/threonine-protein kinase
MTHAKSLAELIAEWEEQSGDGKTVALEELCMGVPELLEPLRAQIVLRGEMNSAMATRKIEPSDSRTTSLSERPDDHTFSAELPTVPGYRIVRELGRGGMGIVYLAVQEGLERLVAIKMLPQGMDTQRTLNRFQTEAEVIARLQHPNLIQIYEVGTVAGRPFFSMEYVPDGTLEARLHNRPQPPREAAQLIQVLASAMHEAHRCGVVHRDLKPGNILLRREGGLTEEMPRDSGVWVSSTPEATASFCPKITDFGLAKRLDEAEGMTLTHSVLGTPCYMAPEQAKGDSKNVTERTDIYSLGAILYELLTGHPPFKGGTLYITLQLVSTVDPAPLRTIQPGVPRDLEVICLKCLQKNPARRYAKVIDLALDLRRFLAGEPIEARPTPQLERLVKWARRHPGLAAAIAVGVVAFSALFAGVAYHNVQLQRALKAEYASAVESQHRLVRLELAQGNNALEKGDSALAMLWFADALRLDDPARDKAHRIRVEMARLSAPSLRQIWFHGEAVPQVGFSSDSARAVTAGEDGTARVWGLETLAPIGAPLVHPAAVTDASLGGDGLVVTGCADGLGRIWNLMRGSVVSILEHQGPLSCARFDPQGRTILTASQDGTAKIWSADGKHLATLKHQGPVNHAAFDSSGRLVVTASDDHTARVWETAHGTAVTPFLQHDSRVVGAALSPDGTQVVTVSDDVAARIWAVKDRAKAPQLLTHTMAATCVAFNANGSRLATGSADGYVRIWDPATGEQMGVPLWHESGVLGVVFHPDGIRIGTCSDDNTARFWDSATGQPLTTLLKHGGNVQCISIDPRGRFILTGSVDGTARLWDIVPDRLAPSTAKQPRSTRAPRDPKKTWWSADRSHYVAAEGTQAVRVHDKNGQAVGPQLRHGSRINFAAFSPDSTRLVTTSEDCTARLWDVATGSMVAPPLKQLGSVRCAAFIPDSRSYVITASTDNTARVWDAATGEPVTPGLRFSGTPIGADFPSEAKVQIRSVLGDQEWTSTWQLFRSSLAVNVLLSKAEILSQSRIDADRGLMPLDFRTLRAAWAQAEPASTAGSPSR